MKTLGSLVQGEWFRAESGFATLHDPCSGKPVAQASSAGVDFEAALTFAREHGGPALRSKSIAERGDMLLELSKALHGAREELIELSLTTCGTTRKDGKFDIDGAIFTLAHYGRLGQSAADSKFILDGEGEILGRSPRFWGQHVRIPLSGCAVHINAFNFPAWGLAEKAACAWLAGMPVMSKPATSTSIVTERMVEVLDESGHLPKGALSLICGSTGNLLDLLGAQDVVAFTGSAATARMLKGGQSLLDRNVRFNVEADSLNSATLAPDVEVGSELWDLFLNEVVREMTQKTGQKCTAVRRIFVPQDRLDDVQEAMIDRLSAVKVGHPSDRSVQMGPLATEGQLKDTIAGTQELIAAGAKQVFGTGQRVEGEGCEAGEGYFFAPTLLRLDGDFRSATAIHEREVFGPVATLIGYGGEAAEAAAGVALGGGVLVSSLYTDSMEFMESFLLESGSSAGRIYIGSTKVAPQMPGSGLVLPSMVHGGPGRAGGGEELGGWRGLALYSQRLGVMGDRLLMERIGATRKSQKA